MRVIELIEGSLNENRIAARMLNKYCIILQDIFMYTFHIKALSTRILRSVKQYLKREVISRETKKEVKKEEKQKSHQM